MPRPLTIALVALLSAAAVGAYVGGAAPTAVFLLVFGIVGFAILALRPAWTAFVAGMAPMAIVMTGRLTFGLIAVVGVAGVAATRVSQIRKGQWFTLLAVVGLAAYIVLSAFFLNIPVSVSADRVRAFMVLLTIALVFLILRPPAIVVLLIGWIYGVVMSLLVIRDDPWAFDRAADYFGILSNSGAAIASLGIVCALVSLYELDRFRVAHVLVIVATILVCGQALLMTGSRGGILCLVGVIAYLAAANLRRPWGLPLLAAVGILVALAALSPDLLNDITDRSDSSFSGSDEERARALNASIKTFMDYPVVGVGFARLPYVMFENGLVPYPLSPHNAIASVAGELGIVGIVFFAGLILTAIFRTTGRTRLMITPVLLFFVILSVFDAWYASLLVSPAFWAALGLGLAGPAREDITERVGAAVTAASHRVGHPIRAGSP